MINASARTIAEAVEIMGVIGSLMMWARDSERFVYNPDFQKFIDELVGISR